MPAAPRGHQAEREKCNAIVLKSTEFVAPCIHPIAYQSLMACYLRSWMFGRSGLQNFPKGFPRNPQVPLGSLQTLVWKGPGYLLDAFWIHLWYDFTHRLILKWKLRVWLSWKLEHCASWNWLSIWSLLYYTLRRSTYICRTWVILELQLSNLTSLDFTFVKIELICKKNTPYQRCAGPDRTTGF